MQSIRMFEKRNENLIKNDAQDMEQEGEGEIPEASTIIQVEDEEEKEQGVAADKVANGDNVPLIPSPLFIRGLYPDLSQQLQVSVTVLMNPTIGSGIKIKKSICILDPAD